MLKPLQRLTGWAGSDQSAMSVAMFGLCEGRRTERRWTLIADNGDGPETPALSVPLLVAQILAGIEAPGARDAGQSLQLGDYQPAFDSLAICHEVIERDLPPLLYTRVMADRFARLPAAVRAMHDVLRDGGASGEAIVTGATNPIARLIAYGIDFPVAGKHRLNVRFTERDGVETWTRDFGGQQFRSRLRQDGRWLVERFGPLRFGFELPSNEQGLVMVLRRWWIWPVRSPLLLAPRSRGREWEEDGRFHLDVPISLPLLGRIVHYQGWLEPDVAMPDRHH